jgi:hypothetical protein
MSRVGIAHLKAHSRRIYAGCEAAHDHVVDRNTPWQIVPYGAEPAARAASRHQEDRPTFASARRLRKTTAWLLCYRTVSRGDRIVDTSALLASYCANGEGAGGAAIRDALVSSELITVESLRTIDRLRLQGALSLKKKRYSERDDG